MCCVVYGRYGNQYWGFIKPLPRGIEHPSTQYVCVYMQIYLNLSISYDHGTHDDRFWLLSSLVFMTTATANRVKSPMKLQRGCKLLLGKLLLGYSLVVSHASPWLWVKWSTPQNGWFKSFRSIMIMWLQPFVAPLGPSPDLIWSLLFSLFEMSTGWMNTESLNRLKL